MGKMINTISRTVNDLKYTFVSIGGGFIATIPEWIHGLGDWFVIIAQVCGGIAAFAGLLKMIDQFLLRRVGIDMFNRGREKTLK